MKVNYHNERKWEGELHEAPRYVRWALVPWYRRILVAPWTLYLLSIVGTTLADIDDSGWRFWALLPTYALLYLIATKANERWYEERAEEHATPDQPLK